MNKVIGYGVSFVGLIIIALGFGDFASGIPILKEFSSGVITSIGLVFVVIGVVFSLMNDSGSSKQEKKEVPIYKDKEIVGYRRA